MELCAAHPASSKGTWHDRERNSSDQLLRPEEVRGEDTKSCFLPSVHLERD